MDVERIAEPTAREAIEHMHELHQAALKCQLEGFKLVINRLLAFERRLERIESYVINASRASNL